MGYDAARGSYNHRLRDHINAGMDDAVESRLLLHRACLTLDWWRSLMLAMWDAGELAIEAPPEDSPLFPPSSWGSLSTPATT